MSALTRTVDERDDRRGQRGHLFSTPFVLRRASGNYRAGLAVLIGDDQKSGSDLALVSRVKELLRGSRAGVSTVEIQ